ncbi:hypothetical protein LG314_00805 [Agrococcus terreus]|uniref:endonuclease domain-containing protein n=1 Tax=Agrococcus terreus TaxID=574649 RepID=UPI00384ABAE3
MSRARPLPHPLQQRPFTVHAARAAGVAAGRLRARDLDRPFHGVRTHGRPGTVEQLAAAFAERMRPGHVIAGRTAAQLWGLPLDRAWRPGEPLVIGIPVGAPRTRASGTRTRAFDPDRLSTGRLDGIPILGPASAVLSMASDARHDELVMLLDAIVTPSTHYPSLRLLRRPHASVPDLVAFADSCRGIHGAPAFWAALGEVRPGADSPQETRARLALVRAGLPEPVLQLPVLDEGVLIAEIDLAYPELRIAVEYEGEHHLTDPAQWAKDILRQERLEALGWIVIRATKRDLADGGRRLVARVRAAIARRSLR